MLKIEKAYRDQRGKTVLIGGRIKNYSEFFPFVWSVGGDWYDEQTGRFVFTCRTNGVYLAVTHTCRCIVDHSPIND